jgi:hypothetical protein
VWHSVSERAESRSFAGRRRPLGDTRNARGGLRRRAVLTADDGGPGWPVDQGTVAVAEPLLEVPDVVDEVLGVVLEVVVVVVLVVVVERCVVLVGVLVWLLVDELCGAEERLVLLDGFPLFALTSATATPAASARSRARAISHARPAPNVGRGSARLERAADG